MTHLFHYCNLLANKQLLEKKAPGTYCTECEQHRCSSQGLFAVATDQCYWLKDTWIATEEGLCCAKKVD